MRHRRLTEEVRSGEREDLTEEFDIILGHTLSSLLPSASPRSALKKTRRPHSGRERLLPKHFLPADSLGIATGLQRILQSFSFRNGRANQGPGLLQRQIRFAQDEYPETLINPISLSRIDSAFATSVVSWGDVPSVRLHLLFFDSKSRRRRHYDLAVVEYRRCENRPALRMPTTYFSGL
jgi:hypothetical protein